MFPFLLPNTLRSINFIDQIEHDKFKLQDARFKIKNRKLKIPDTNGIGGKGI
jgi:hypothetical protein